MPVAGAGGSAGTSGLALGWGVTGDLERQRRARVGPVEADAQEGQVERVEDELDLPPGQPGVDLVTVAVQRDEGGFGDGAVLGPAERLGQVGRRGKRVGAAFQPARQRPQARSSHESTNADPLST
jgi:hypothetical protein